ncbi:MAG: glycosyltransferase family 9 protein [Roseomonas sp.]|nr:glycosyltransferase family 9 protein [Roseomonas sp.]MCA3327196.1 glycosyltransferase family 9 protein [Roseomonas sp.]MCA3330087.1 glycosyltransferase family 9 protein [Roseomonas sp.]MCA3333749.1 glycosyltransferase family 9 protein [Roseomonas sp.]MCA3347956.1 glycosyltransferase family 9 protein [Roseomonas sp.]
MRAHPQARFTIVCGRVAEGVFRRMPRLERLISVEKRRYSLHWLEIWGALAFTRWDLVVDLRASAIAWLLWTRARKIIQGGRRPGHRLVHLAALLGVSPPPLPVIWAAPEDISRAATLLPEGRNWLVLGPTANWHRKVWPAGRFVEVALRLTAADGALPGAGIAILGGPGDQERSMATPVLTALPQALDLVGKLDLPEVAAVLARAAMFIGNDSGLMHLAAAAGAPTLGLFGPTPSDEYGPAGPKAQAVLADGPPGQGVMEDLPVARVLEAAEALIGQAARVPA